MRKTWTIIFILIFTYPVYAQLPKESPHVLQIIATDCLTSGGALTGFQAEGLSGIVTALHGVVGCENIRARIGGTDVRFRDLRIIKVDIEHDVALLSSPEFLQLSQPNGFETQNQGINYNGLYVIGYPHEMKEQLISTDLRIRQRPQRPLHTLIPASLTESMRKRNSPSLETVVLSIEGHLSHGHSGAPILNEYDEVIGIANGGLQDGTTGIVWAIPWQTINWKDRSKMQDELLDLAHSSEEPVSFSLSQSELKKVKQYIDIIHLNEAQEYEQASMLIEQAFDVYPSDADDLQGYVVAAHVGTGDYAGAAREVLKRDKRRGRNDYKFKEDLAHCLRKYKLKNSILEAIELTKNLKLEYGDRIVSYFWSVIPGSIMSKISEGVHGKWSINESLTSEDIKNIKFILRTYPDDRYIDYGFYLLGEYGRALEANPQSLIKDILLYAKGYEVVRTLLIRYKYLSPSPNSDYSGLFKKNFGEPLKQFTPSSKELSLIKTAINDFTEYIRNYPDRPHADDSAYWRAWLEASLGHKNIALEMLDEVRLYGPDDWYKEYEYIARRLRFNLIKDSSYEEIVSYYEKYHKVNLDSLTQYAIEVSEYKKVGQLVDFISSIDRQHEYSGSVKNFVKMRREIEIAMASNDPSLCEKLSIRLRREYHDRALAMLVIDEGLRQFSKSHSVDYLMYLKTITHRFYHPDEMETVVKNFYEYYPDSQYIDDALAELVWYYLAEKNDLVSAEKVVNRILQEYPNSNACDNAIDWLVKSYTIECSDQKNDKSQYYCTKLKRLSVELMTNYPFSRFARNALKNLVKLKQTELGIPFSEKAELSPSEISNSLMVNVQLDKQTYHAEGDDAKIVVQSNRNCYLKLYHRNWKGMITHLQQYDTLVQARTKYSYSLPIHIEFPSLRMRDSAAATEIIYVTCTSENIKKDEIPLPNQYAQEWVKYHVTSNLSPNATVSFQEKSFLQDYPKTFTGTIGKDLKIQMELHNQNDTIWGTYFYIKNIPYLNLKGNIDNTGNFVLYEYQESSQETGVFTGRFLDPDTLQGTWSNPQKTRNYPFHLKKISSFKQGGNCFQTFTGTIDDDLKIQMEFHTQDNIISGTYFYIKNIPYLNLKGNIDNTGNFMLYEYQENAQETGIFTGRFLDPDTLQGTWSNPQKTRSYPFHMESGRKECME